MSKRKKKCISCGAWMSVNTKKCPSCGFDPSAGNRVERQPKPCSEEQEPKPVQTAIFPEQDEAPAEPISLPVQDEAPAEPVSLSMQDEVPAEPTTPPEQDAVLKEPDVPREEDPEAGADSIWERPAKKTDAAREEKQEPYRAVGMSYEDYIAGKRKARRNTWQFVAVLGVIAAIIIVAVILVLKMTEDTVPAEVSQTFDTVHILSQDGKELGTATNAPAADNEDTQKPEDETASAEPEDGVPAEDAEESEVTEMDDTVYVANSGVNLRSGASTTYEVLASLAKGVELHRTGKVDGWSRVEYDDMTGYVSDSLITTEAPEGSSSQSVDVTGLSSASGSVTVVSDANLRKGPGTGYDVVAVAKSGTVLTLTGTLGNWSQVSYNGQSVFVSNSLVTSGSASAQTTGSAGTVTANQKANIRSGAGTDYAVLGVVDKGTSLEYTGVSGNWYKVNYNGQTGYINGNMVSSGSGTATSSATTGTLVVISEANVRSGAGTGYDKLGIAPVGMEMTFSDHTATNWYQVSYNGKTGYIAGNLVSVK